MAAAPIPRKTYSEIYTATREAEQKLLEAENGLDSQLRRLHDQLAPPAVAYIKKVMGKLDDAYDLLELDQGQIANGISEADDLWQMIDYHMTG